MGLGVGVTVKKQLEQYMSEGRNPKGTIQEIEADFNTFLRGKFPEDRFTPRVDLTQDEEYDFDVQLAYNWNNYDATPMIMAILEYVCGKFSQSYGIDMRVSSAA